MQQQKYVYTTINIHTHTLENKQKTQRGPQTDCSRTNSHTYMTDELTYRPTNRSLHENRQSKRVSDNQNVQPTSSQNGKQPLLVLRRNKESSRQTKQTHTHTQIHKVSKWKSNKWMNVKHTHLCRYMGERANTRKRTNRQNVEPTNVAHKTAKRSSSGDVGACLCWFKWLHFVVGGGAIVCIAAALALNSDCRGGLCSFVEMAMLAFLLWMSNSAVVSFRYS